MFSDEDNHVVAVVEVVNENDPALLGLIPIIFSAVLDEHGFIVNIIVLVRGNNLPKSRAGEKQRHLAREMWDAKQL